MKVTQPRTQNDEGMYFGCRAIRVVTEALFEWLGLGPMLHRERARASESLRRKAQKANRKVTDFMRRITKGLRNAFTFRPQRSRAEQEKREEAAATLEQGLARNTCLPISLQTSADDEQTRNSDCQPTTAPADTHNRIRAYGRMGFF